MSVQQTMETAHKPVSTQMEAIFVLAHVVMHFIPTIVPVLVSTSVSAFNYPQLMTEYSVLYFQISMNA